MLNKLLHHSLPLIAVLFSTSCLAQAELSLYAGPVIKQATVDHHRTNAAYQAAYENMTLFCAGLKASFPLNEEWAWESGLRYMRKDYKARVKRSFPNQFQYSLYQQLQIHAWELPVSVSYKLSQKLIKRDVKLHAGFALSYQRHRQYGFNFGNFTFHDSGSGTAAVTSNYKVERPVSAAAEAGITFFPVLWRRFEAGILYHLDLLPVAGKTTYTSEMYVSTPTLVMLENVSGSITPKRTSYVMLSLGYRLSIEKKNKAFSPRFQEND